MGNSPTRRIVAAYILLSSGAGLAGNWFPTIAYLITVGACAVLFARTSFRLAPTHRSGLRFSYLLLAITASVFGLARFIHDVSGPAGWDEQVYIVAYFLAMVSAVAVIFARRRIESAAVLEATMVAIGVVVVLSHSLAVTTNTPGPDPVAVAVVGGVAFSVALGFLGRTRQSGITKSWFVAGVLAAGAELAVGLADSSPLAEFLGTNFASSPLVAVAIGAVSVGRADSVVVGEIPPRRQFGRRQLLVAAFLVLLPVSFLAHAVVFDVGEEEQAFLVLATAVVMVAALLRMNLMIISRDVDNQREILLRELADRFVEATTEAEVVGDEALALVAELVGTERCFVGIVDGCSEGLAFSQIHTRGHTGAVTHREPLVVVGGQGDDFEALESLRPAESSFAVAVPLRSECHRYLLVGANRRLGADLIPHLQSAAAQFDLGFAAQDLRERAYQRRADDRFGVLVQDSHDFVFLVDRDTLEIAFVSPTIARLLGHHPAELLGGSPFAIFGDSDAAIVERRLPSRGMGEAPALDRLPPIDVRLRHSGNYYVWYSLSIRDLTDESELSGYLFSFAEIHERKMVELQLAAAESRYRAMVTNANDVIILLQGGLISYVTPNVERLFGYRSQDLIGARANAFLNDQANAEVDQFFQGGSLTRPGVIIEAEVQTSGGETRTVELTFVDPELGREEVMVTLRDVTERRILETSLRDRALYDDLTGMFNRASIYPELQRTLQGLEEGDRVAIVQLDIKDFKAINDSLGYATGDEVLVAVATRLRSALRRDDTIARINGDEFCLVTMTQSTEQAMAFVSRIEALFDEPFTISGRKVLIRVVMGMITTDDRMDNGTTLLESVGLALNHAKASGRDLAVYQEWMRAEATERFELATGIIGGLERDEFFVVYQPLLDLESQQVTSTEALLRWQHPERGFVSPAVFIPLAEESLAILEVGRWVLDKACRQLAAWHATLPNASGLSISVNVSARQLETESETARLKTIIAESGIDPRSLILELTESVMAEDIEGLRQRLEEFRAMGIRIAVDDFGTGAAGLGHLRDVPFDIVKIDKSYIDGLGQSEEAHKLIAGVIELAHGMGARIVAEGIETPDQAAQLRRMRCDYGQGYYLGRPMEPERLEAWFEQGRAGAAAASIVMPAR